MPLYELECSADSCGDRIEALLTLREYEAGQWPVCPTCQSPMKRIYLPSHQRAQHCDPILIFEKADGSGYSFPGRNDKATPPGYIRRELQPAEARQVMRRVNAIERRKIDDRVVFEQQWLESVEAQNRPELRQAMQHMTPMQREFAELAIAHNNARRPKTEDANVFIEALEFDASNRDRWDDRDRRGRPRK